MATSSAPLTPASVAAAHKIIKPLIHRTPVLTSTTLSELAGVKLFLKCENLQKIGAFKIRGVSYAISQLSDEELRRGVVTHSSGNHAQALALAARTVAKTRGFPVPAYVVMPSVSAPSKIAGTKGYGAEVTFSGSTAAEREAVVAEVQKRTGAVLIPPYDHRDIILGQGTVGLELLEQVEEGLDAIITPCGGGGLLAGVATAVAGSGVRVYGSEPELDGADDCVRGLKSGKRIEAVKSLTVADGLRTPVGKINWETISDPAKVKGVFSVTEQQILDAMRLVVERCKILIEPSSAVPVAVLLYSEEWKKEVAKAFPGKKEIRVGVVLSGGNTTIERISQIFSGSQA